MVAQSHHSTNTEGDPRVITDGGGRIDEIGRAGLADFMNRTSKTVAAPAGGVVRYRTRPPARFR
jgi:hypothetical protein